MRIVTIYLFIFIGCVVLLHANDEVKKPIISVVMPEGEKFVETYEGILEELEDDYRIHQVFYLNNDTEVIKELEKVNPDAIVLMENRTLNIAHAFQKSSSILKDKPIFPLMALRVELGMGSLRNATAIKFEIPAYTIFSNLKYISSQKFKNVFVVYRKEFQSLIDLSRKMIAKEKLELNAYCVDCGVADKLSNKQIAKRSIEAFNRMNNDGEVDVAWMLADNVLIKATLKSLWISKIVKNNIPYIAPIDKFVENEVLGGMIAFYPDYRNLGTQVSDKIREILEENNGVVEHNTVEELISVFSVLNKKRADNIEWNLNGKNLERLKKIYD